MLSASFSVYSDKAFELLANFYQIWWRDNGHKILSSCKIWKQWLKRRERCNEEKANKLILLYLRESTWESRMEEKRGN